MNFFFLVCGKHVFLVEFFKHCENDCPAVLQKCQKTCVRAAAVKCACIVFTHEVCSRKSDGKLPDAE